MTLYICAIIICLFSIVGLSLEVRSQGQRAVVSPRFWCEVVVVVVTLLLFFVASRDQQIESAQKALTAERQVSELERVRNTQEGQRSQSDHMIRIQELQLEKQEAQLEKQEAQLAGAKDLAIAQDEQKETLRRLVESQRGEIQLLNRLTLNHNLSGIEVAFTPSRERWKKISAAYGRTNAPPQQGVSYIDAAMTAERDGDHWRIVFDPIKLKEGNKKLDRLTTADANNKAFEDVLNEALLGLRIEWGNGTNTALEPWSKDYPATIYVSHEKIALTLRPPLVLWNLNELKDNPTVKFYGRDYPTALPPSFTIRSLDPAVAFNQTIQLDWKKRAKSTDYDFQMNRQVSGPHKLGIAFRFVKQVSAGLDRE